MSLKKQEARDDPDRGIREVLMYIRATPDLLSLLYDCDLLPRDLDQGSRDWFRMVFIARAWQNRRNP